VSHLGFGNGTVAGVWREHRIQPWVSNSSLRVPFFTSGLVQMVEAGGVAF
jgi:hypothetical protein